MVPVQIFFLIFLTFLSKSCDSFVQLLTEELTLPDKNKADFEKFKTVAKPLMPAEYMKMEIILMKYFRHCEMNADKAIQRVKDNVAFREKMGYHKVPDADMKEFDAAYPHSFIYDNYGRVVLYIVGKDWDMARASGNPDYKKRWTAWVYSKFEKMYEMSTNAERVPQAIGNGFLMEHKSMDPLKSVCLMCLDLTKSVFGEVENRWPGGLQFGIVVNADPVIHVSLNIVKNVLSEFLRKYVFIYDENDVVWMPKVGEIMSEDKLPPGVWRRSKQIKG